MQLNHPRIAGAAAQLAGLLFLFAAPGAADAYPQFQLSTYSNTCTACHFSPSGGGLINGFGRDESADTISQFGGDGGFLHGLWAPPDWLGLGLDFRYAAIYKETSTEPQFMNFPMQLDTYLRFAFGDFSVNLISGFRARGRQPGERTAMPWSREHYVMWKPADSSYYARVGRFFAPYGLRLIDHRALVRRYLGQHTLEETYNLSVGRIDDAWELHGTLYTPSPLFHVGRKATGAALYYERRVREDSAAIGAQTRVDFSSEDGQFWLGGVGKMWFDDLRVMLLAQLDLGVQTFRFDGADPRLQLAGYFGATYFIKQGYMLGAAIDRYDADLTLSGAARDSVNVSFQYFPYAHVELMLVGKLAFAGGIGASPSPETLLMLHYYL